MAASRSPLIPADSSVRLGWPTRSRAAAAAASANARLGVGAQRRDGHEPGQAQAGQRSTRASARAASPSAGSRRGAGSPSTDWLQQHRQRTRPQPLVDGPARRRVEGVGQPDRVDRLHPGRPRRHHRALLRCRLPTKCHRGAARGRSARHLGDLGGGLLRAVLGERVEPEVEQRRDVGGREGLGDGEQARPRRARPAAAQAAAIRARTAASRRELGPRASTDRPASSSAAQWDARRNLSARVPLSASPAQGLRVEPGERGEPPVRPSRRWLKSVAVLDRAPRVDADPGHAERGQLAPQPGPQVQARGAPAGPAGAARQARLDVGPHRRGDLVAAAAHRRPEQHLDGLDARAELRHGRERGGHDPGGRRRPGPRAPRPTTPARGSASSTGTQSAASTASAEPGQRGHGGVGARAIRRARLRDGVDRRHPHAVHLLQAHQPATPSSRGQPAPVGGDGRPGRRRRRARG